MTQKLAFSILLGGLDGGRLVTTMVRYFFIFLFLVSATLINSVANAKPEGHKLARGGSHQHHRRIKISVRQKSLNENFILACGEDDENEDGSADKVRYFLKQGAQINAVDDGGRTGLTQAAANHRFQIVKFLLQHGAHVNKYAPGSAGGSDEGGTALGLVEQHLFYDRKDYEEDYRLPGLDPYNLAVSKLIVEADVLIIRRLKRAGAKTHVKIVPQLP